MGCSSLSLIIPFLQHLKKNSKEEVTNLIRPFYLFHKDGILPNPSEKEHIIPGIVPETGGVRVLGMHR